MITRQCLTRRTAQPCRPTSYLHPRRPFHSSSCRREDGTPNHYATLEVAINASPGEIKKQFYKLSKAHHPDLHPNDPTAAERFVLISEAHTTLGSADKKAQYDRDFLRSQPSSATPRTPTGSFSSASTHAGGRPASGLSRRRTQFRGPPPSFYRSGGWGEHSEKRGEAASSASHSHEAQAQAQTGPAGTGPGGFTAGFNNDVPHFDHEGHLKTHSTIEQTRHRARRKVRVQAAESDDPGPSALFNFIVISGVLFGTFGISGSLLGWGDERKRKAQNREG